MKRIILVAVAVMAMAAVTGCGGGGSSSGTPAPAAQKISVVDGTWNSTIPNGLGGNILVGSIYFYDGTVMNSTYISNSYSYKKGTFTISGDSMTINYTSSDYGTTITSLNNLQPSAPASVIHENIAYKFTITGNVLTLKDGAGVLVGTYTK